MGNLQEFDSFFIGDGSKQLMDIQERRHQLFHVNSFMGSRGEFDKGDVVDDSGDFVCEKSDLPKDKFQEVFFKCKKEVYERFNFIAIKSASRKGKAIREVDLILEDSDLHVIEYLRGKITDKFAVQSVAVFLAYENMGISEVLFRGKDGCALCKVFDGSVFSTYNLTRIFSSGGYIVHPYCNGEFFPVIRRSIYEGSLKDTLNIDTLSIGDRKVYNFPVEYNYEGFRKLLAELPCGEISFVDFDEYRNRITSEKDVDSLVVHFNEKENILYIHNEYMGAYGPMDYLKEYLKSEGLPAKISVANFEGLEKYYLDGRTVVMWDGSYWDPVTGERVK
jgi:hypothetical protein